MVCEVLSSVAGGVASGETLEPRPRIFIVSEKLFTDFINHQVHTSIMKRVPIHTTTHLQRTMFSGEKLYPIEPITLLERGEPHQARGCKIAAHLLEITEDPEEQDYLNRLVSPALFGSAWYDAFVESRDGPQLDRMYRILDLPRLDLAPTDDLATKTWQAGITHVKQISNHRPVTFTLVRPEGKGNAILMAHAKEIYKSLGLGSLWLANVNVARHLEKHPSQNREVTQEAVRGAGYRLVERTYSLAREIGSLPLIGNFDDPYSDLTIKFQRSCPGHMKAGYEEALESMPKAA